MNNFLVIVFIKTSRMESSTHVTHSSLFLLFCLCVFSRLRVNPHTFNLRLKNNFGENFFSPKKQSVNQVSQQRLVLFSLLEVEVQTCVELSPI